MKQSRLIPLFSLLGLPNVAPPPRGVSPYSSAAAAAKSHRQYWKGSLNRLYGRISQVKDLKTPISPILDQWIHQGGTVKKHDLITIIKELTHFKLFNQALQVSMWMTDKRYFELSESDVAHRLDLIAKANGVEQAENYFNNIPQQLKDLKVYCALLNCYASAKHVEKADATMQKMMDLGLARTSLPYNILLTLYHRTGEHDKFDTLVNEMEEKGIGCNRFTYGIKLNACAAASDFVGVDNILAKWESVPEDHLDWMNYAIVANAYIKAGNVDKALAMLKKCEELITSSKRQREAYEHLMPQYAALEKKDDVVRLWELYKKKMKVYARGYKIVMTSLLKIGDIESAEKIFEEWESRHSTYDIRITNHLIAAYTRKGLLDKTESLINRVILKGGKPDAKSWRCLAKLHLDHHQNEKAVESMKKSLLAMQPGWKTDKDVWASCLEYLKKKPDPEGAKEFIELLGDKHIIPAHLQKRC